MIQWFLSFLGGPIIKGALDAYRAKLDAGSKHEVLAADLASKELLVQAKEIEVQGQLRIAQVGRWYEPEKIFAYILALYFSKLVVWDKVIGSFVGYTDNAFQTDPLTGEAVAWAAMIMMFLFGKRSIENAIRLWKS